MIQKDTYLEFLFKIAMTLAVAYGVCAYIF